MTDPNKTILIGRCVKDGELIKGENKKTRLVFPLAVNRSVKKGENWVDEVSYFDITLWDKTAENLQQYITKGKVIYIEGYLRQDRWTDSTGKNMSKINIIVEVINPFIERVHKNENSSEQNGFEDKVYVPNYEDVVF